MQTWEQIAAAAIAVLVLFFFSRGLKGTMERSKQAEKDWPGLLIPMAFVVGLIIFVIMLLR